MAPSYQNCTQLQMNGVNCPERNQPCPSHKLVLFNLKSYRKEAEPSFQKRREGRKVRRTRHLPRIPRLPEGPYTH